MAKIIEFYTPQSFRKASKWFLPSQVSKVLPFRLPETKTDVIWHGNTRSGVILSWLETR
jgi:hypothetical protein